MTLELNDQEIRNTQAEIAIRTLAVRMANAVIMIELSTTNPEEANRFKNRFANLIREYETDIYEGLFAKRGKIDLEEILNYKL